MANEDSATAADTSPDAPSSLQLSESDLKALRERVAEKQRLAREWEANRESNDLQSVMTEIQQTAAAATGMSVPELMGLAATAVPEPPPRPRISRSSAAARRIPEIHLRHVFDQEPNECEALRVIRSFLASEATLLVMTGGVGTQKTGSAAWALTQVSGIFVRADELGQITASRDEESIDLGRKLKRVDLLVLDDLGTEYSDEKGWFIRSFTGLINARYEACLKTIVTCNLTAEQFKSTYGERIADRIREAGRFVVISGQSVRRK